jgi:phenylpyruvate tautomerase PptA (4-oxalocrotonate tautomerase family)
MPIVDIEIVTAGAAEFEAITATSLADALGPVFGSPRGGTWVRLHRLDSRCYAENDEPAPPQPVFVTVLHAQVPTGAALEAEVRALTQRVAEQLHRPVEHVHVQYAPPAIGRQAFGGRLVQAPKAL